MNWQNPLSNRIRPGAFISDINAKVPQAKSFGAVLGDISSTGPTLPKPVMFGGAAFIQNNNPDLVVCDDGTVIDIKTKKILRSPHRDSSGGYWGDPNRMIDNPGTGSEWKDEDINFLPHRKSDIGIDCASQAYWDQVEREGRQLEKNMTDEQRRMLKDLETGKITKPCALETIDESKTHKV